MLSPSRQYNRYINRINSRVQMACLLICNSKRKIGFLKFICSYVRLRLNEKLIKNYWNIFFISKSCSNISGMSRWSLNKNMSSFCVESAWLQCYKGLVAYAQFWGECGNLASGDGPGLSCNPREKNLHDFYLILVFTHWHYYFKPDIPEETKAKATRNIITGMEK